MLPRKVLFLSPVGVLGGAERSLVDLLRSLRSAAPSVELALITAAEGPLVEEVAAMGIRTRVVPMPASFTAMGDSELPSLEALLRSSDWRRHPLNVGFDFASYLRRLRKAVTEEKPSLIHSNGLKTHVVAALLRAPAPLVWHMRDFIGDRALTRTALRLLERRVACAVANSSATAADLRAHLPSVNVEVVYNGIDVDHFCPGPSAAAWLDKRANMQAGEPGLLRIGLISTYARWKGQELFLRAIAHYSVRFGLSPAVRFFVIGGPIYRTMTAQYSVEELRGVADLVGVNERVGFVPFQEDPRDVYRGLDIVVHSSIRPEPFGRTIAEAMATGRPTIVANAGGAAELVQDGVNGLAVDPGDVQALAVAMRRLVESPELRDGLGMRARQTAVERFSAARLGPEMLRIYERSLGSGFAASAVRSEA